MPPTAGRPALQRDIVVIGASAAHELWGLRSDEVVGRHFLSLDIGLPVERVGGEIRAALNDEAAPSTVTIEAVNRRGKRFECRVRVLPLMDRQGLELRRDAVDVV